MDQAFALCPHGCGSAVLVGVWKQECGDGMEKHGPGWTVPDGDGLHSPLTGKAHQCPVLLREMRGHSDDIAENTTIF